MARFIILTYLFALVSICSFRASNANSRFYAANEKESLQTEKCRRENVYYVDCNKCVCNPDTQSYDCTNDECQPETLANLTEAEREAATCPRGNDYRAGCEICKCYEKSGLTICTEDKDCKDPGQYPKYPEYCPKGEFYHIGCNTCYCDHPLKKYICTQSSC